MCAAGPRRGRAAWACAQRETIARAARRRQPHACEASGVRGGARGARSVSGDAARELGVSSCSSQRSRLARPSRAQGVHRCLSLPQLENRHMGDITVQT